jgi:outer membrane lipoprotein-sorting protein
MRFLRPIFVLTAAIAILPAADDLQAVYAKIDSGAAGFKGLTADIRQAAHTDVINEDDVATGKIVVKRPKPRDIRMRIDFQEPNQKQVAFAGNKADIYYPKTNTDDEYDLGKHKGMLEQFMLLGFGTSSQDLRSAYSIRLIGAEAVNGQPTKRIELIPKSKEMLQIFPKIELWISDATGMALQQKLYDKGGKDYHLATYSNMKLRSDIADSEVKLNLPTGVHRTNPLK